MLKGSKTLDRVRFDLKSVIHIRDAVVFYAVVQYFEGRQLHQLLELMNVYENDRYYSWMEDLRERKK